MNDKQGRTDTASRYIAASPAKIYAAFVDPELLVRWLPPSDMRGEVQLFEPRVGGRYQIILHYQQGDPEAAGKTSDLTDVVRGRFLALEPGRKIVQAAEFDSDDAAFAGTMTITWTLDPDSGGTRVTVTCENVPEGISAEDHAAGFQSTLEKLAALTERQA